MSRYRRRTDTTHQEIADALRACGWSVESVHIGPLCDMVAWKYDDPTSVRLIEAKSVKSGTGRVVRTQAQIRLAARGCPVITLTSAAEAARLT